MQNELHRQLDALDRDEAVRVIVVTGEGRLFSAGAGMEPGGNNFAFDEEQHRRAKADMAARPRPWRMRTPIIGALNGSAVGIGLTFPLQWDIRIVNESAKYGFVFTRRGLIPEQNSLWLLPKLVGLATAVELLMTGRLFTGAEAKALGLATEAVPGRPGPSPRQRDRPRHRDEHGTGRRGDDQAIDLRDARRQTTASRRSIASGKRSAGWVDRAIRPRASQSFLAKRPPQFTSSKHTALPAVDGRWAVSNG